MLQTEPVLPVALPILSAMITPAVLILGTSSLVVATSGRLGRTLDRARSLTERLTTSALVPGGAAAAAEGQVMHTDETILALEREVLYDLLGRTARRARLLQHALSGLYVALALFLALSAAIGIEAAFARGSAVVLLTLEFGGVGVLLWVSLLLIGESRVALGSVEREMAYVHRLREHYAPHRYPDGPRRG